VCRWIWRFEIIHIKFAIIFGVPLDFGTGVGDSRTRTLVEISGTLKAVVRDHAAEVFGSHPKTAHSQVGR
jgi:hypothetical protein